MLSSEEIRSITFERSMRGYRTEDVDAFLEKIAAGVDQLNAERDDLQKKLYILAQKVEEYRSEEETLKSALLNAHRLGENVIHEAKIKSDGMIREATGKAQRILEAADLREREEKDRLRALEAEVTAFKGSILALYQKHIEALSELDGTVEKVHISVFGEEPAPETEEQNAAADESAIESSETPQEMAVPDENEGQN